MLNILALPKGALNTARYDRPWVAPALLREENESVDAYSKRLASYKSAPALQVLLTQSKVLGNVDIRFYPLRHTSIVKLEWDGDVLYVTSELGEYVDWTFSSEKLLKMCKDTIFAPPVPDTSATEVNIVEAARREAEGAPAPHRRYNPNIVSASSSGMTEDPFKEEVATILADKLFTSTTKTEQWHWLSECAPVSDVLQLVRDALDERLEGKITGSTSTQIAQQLLYNNEYMDTLDEPLSVEIAQDIPKIAVNLLQASDQSKGAFVNKICENLMRAYPGRTLSTQDGSTIAITTMKDRNQALETYIKALAENAISTYISKQSDDELPKAVDEVVISILIKRYHTIITQLPETDIPPEKYFSVFTVQERKLIPSAENKDVASAWQSIIDVISSRAGVRKLANTVYFRIAYLHLLEDPFFMVRWLRRIQSKPEIQSKEARPLSQPLPFYSGYELETNRTYQLELSFYSSTEDIKEPVRGSKIVPTTDKTYFALQPNEIEVNFRYDKPTTYLVVLPQNRTVYTPLAFSLKPSDAQPQTEKKEDSGKITLSTSFQHSSGQNEAVTFALPAKFDEPSHGGSADKVPLRAPQFDLLLKLKEPFLKLWMAFLALFLAQILTTVGNRFVDIVDPQPVQAGSSSAGNASISGQPTAVITTGAEATQSSTPLNAASITTTNTNPSTQAQPQPDANTNSGQQKVGHLLGWAITEGEAKQWGVILSIIGSSISAIILFLLIRRIPGS
jgi:hypothetical protein